MNRPELDADLCVLLTPRELGGHEVALLGWLADAVRAGELKPLIVAPTPELVQACAARGLAACLWPLATPGPEAPELASPRFRWLRLLLAWPAGRPLLLAPGVLHANAWLLAAALLLRRQVWVYAPMTHTAVRMGYPAAALRDRLLVPWLRRVDAWVALDTRQAQSLATTWRVQAPVHVLPNVARVAGAPPPQPASAADGRLRVAYVGRFDPWQKGLDWLATEIAAQPAWAEACHWRFQGRGPGETALLELASALGPHRVVVKGFAPLDEALAASDVLLLPSRYEGLPLVALEATVRGWPVVASRDAGLDALLPATSLFDFGDAAGLAMALDSLRTATARERAVAHARERYAEQRLSGSYRAALRNLVRALQHGRPSGQAA